MQNPPFRIKVPIKSRETIEIPPTVKYHYENPPPLLPSLRDTLRYDIVKKRKCLPIAPEIISKESVAESLVRDLEALKTAKAKLREIQRELGQKIEGLSSSSENEQDEGGKTRETITDCSKSDTANDNDKQQEGKEKITQKSSVKTRRSKQNSSKSNDENKSSEGMVVVNGKEEASLQTPQEQNKIEAELFIDSDEEVKHDPQIDAELKCLDVDLIKKLAFQRLQQLVQDHPEIVMQYQNRTAARRIRELIEQQQQQQLLPSEILSPTDIRRLSIMFTGETSSILAQPNSASENDVPQLHPALATAAAIVAADEDEKKYVPRERTQQEKAHEVAYRLELKLIRCKIRARAVLTPLGDILEDNRWFSNIELTSSYFMRYRSMHIGYGSGNGCVDVNLSLIGYCSRVSPKHATIFYDDFSKTYELINYSEFGTEVNGQLYSCDFTEPGPTPAKKLRNEDVELQRKVQAILDRRRGLQRQHYVIDRNARFVLNAKGLVENISDLVINIFQLFPEWLLHLRPNANALT